MAYVRWTAGMVDSIRWHCDLTRRQLTPERLKALRRLLGMTQAELAQRCRVSRSYVGMMETGTRPAAHRVVSFITDVFA